MTTTDQRLRELRRELRSLSWRRRRRVLEEARDHLLSALEDGVGDSEAAVRLGEPHLAFAGFPARRRTHRAALVAVPVAFLALASPVSGTLEQIGAGPAPSLAATPGIIQRQALEQARCVAAWNVPANASWRELALGMKTSRAYVMVGWRSQRPPVGEPGPHTLGVPTCGVKLLLAPAATPYQRSVNILARSHGTSFVFYRALRTRTRTRSASPTQNAYLDAQGRLTPSVQRQVAPTCPRTPMGTRILSVVTIPSRTSLVRGATTPIGGGQTAFAVQVRNEGAVTVRAAIVNLELYGPARPHDPVWRSKPVTVQRLVPGSTVGIRFTPPAIGHGVRLVRATTAAVACEVKLADNSPVFRVRAR